MTILNKNSFIYLIIFSFCIVLFLSISVSHSNDITIGCIDRMKIEKQSFNGRGILNLKVKFEFCKKTKVYNWRGQLYPILNYSLFAKAVSPDGSLLTVKNVEHFQPKIYHPKDVKVVNIFEYDKPLRVLISKNNGKSNIKCFEFQLRYDTTKIKTSNILSKININSNEIIICKD